ncbi:hypothetical protein [Enterobacter cloacae]|uniref:hypothetical protein n=1 Tax=Enterobacter cloacae TaxID=550 RepID=UPI003DA1520D
MPVNYAQALAQAILGNTLPQGVNDALTGLLHDMVYLLADYVRNLICSLKNIAGWRLRLTRPCIILPYRKNRPVLSVRQSTCRTRP